MHIAWLGKKTPVCGNVTYGREITNALLDRGHKLVFCILPVMQKPLASNNAANLGVCASCQLIIKRFNQPQSSRIIDRNRHPSRSPGSTATIFIQVHHLYGAIAERQ
jgi:hypothetical protein